MIKLSHGGQFSENDLAAYIRGTGRNYIIQGQTVCLLANHPKPSSLDYWLRSYGASPDTKQADNDIIAKLVATGLFKESHNLLCPDTKRSCKGLVLAK